MTILVIAEHDQQSVKAATLNTLAAAAKLGGDIHVLVAGAGCAAAATQAATLQGVSKVLVADAAHYADQTAENVAALVVAQAGAYSHILAPATTFGKNVLPRVAALLDVAQISEITAVESADTFVRPIYAGNAMATVQSADKIKVITVRTTAFDAVGAGNSAPVEVLAAAADVGCTQLQGRELTKSERPELGAAKIIVSGGRGLGSGDNYHKLLDPLADKLGAAVGVRAQLRRVQRQMHEAVERQPAAGLRDLAGDQRRQRAGYTGLVVIRHRAIVREHHPRPSHRAGHRRRPPAGARHRHRPGACRLARGCALSQLTAGCS